MERKCNTVTFTARDGMKQAFPLDFLIERGAVLADKVNGGDIAAAMGAYNQLWIPGVPAKYYVRDIVGIEFSWEDEPPVLPDFTDDGRDYTNRPNVSCQAAFTGHVGRPMRFEGYADDFDHAIVGVEFSLDGGATWTPCDVEGASFERWVWWRFDYEPALPGRYCMHVRAVNELGQRSPVPAVHCFTVLEQEL